MGSAPSIVFLNTGGSSNGMVNHLHIGKLSGMLKRHFSLICLIFITLFYFYEGNQKSRWRENRVIINDVVIYYSYLPATFIKKDPLWNFYEKNEKEYNQKGQYWAFKSPQGGYIPKMSMGKAMMDLPFFLIADWYTQFISNSPRDGFSRPYQYIITWSTLIYSVLGLLLLRGWLRRFFDDKTTGWTLLALALGTNLFFYATHETGMSHPHNFFLLAAALYIFPLWYNKRSFILSVCFGIVIGLLILIRPINILLLFPIVFMHRPKGMGTIPYLQSILSLKQLLISIAAAIIIWTPQLIFWKIQSGNWLYYSYGNESFFWLKPHVFEGLFSFRKGWFIYTPMMLLAILGLIPLYRKNKNSARVLLLFLCVFLYVTFSWWCWWYGGSFGARTLIDILPLMAFPLAAGFEWVSRQKKRWILFIAPVFFVYLNNYQSWQYSQGFIHFDSMTYEGYTTIFLKDHTPIGYWEKLITPDYENSQKFGEERNSMPLQ